MFEPRQLRELKALVQLPPAVERYLARRPQGRAFVHLFPYPRAVVLYRFQELAQDGRPQLLPIGRNDAGRELALRLDTGHICWTDSPDETLHSSFEAFLKAEGERVRAAKKIPLVNAARRGELNKIRRLIRRGDDIDEIGYHGCTPLMAAILNWQFDAAHLLLDHGPDLAVANRAGDHALLFAALRNRPDLVARMLALGADPNAQTRSGEPVLHFALIGTYQLGLQKAWGSLEVVKLLVEGGADPTVQLHGKSLWENAPPETDRAILDWLKAIAQR